MIESIIYASPDILLLIGAMIMAGLHFSGKENPRVYFLITKLFLMVSMFLSLIFYNKIFAERYLTENSYTTMMKVIIYLLSIAWYYVSFKWFVGRNLSGSIYCICGLLLIEVFDIIISSVSLISLYIGIFLFIIFRNILINHNMKTENMKSENALFDTVVMLISLIGILWIYKVCGSFSYEDIMLHLKENKPDILLCMSLAATMAPLFYMLTIFPLGFNNLNIAEKTILPVNGYISIISPLALFSAVFVMLNMMLAPVYELFRPVIVVLSCLSMFYGAFGAKRETNLSIIFAYSAIYHFGVVLLIMSYMEAYAVLSAYVYFVIYILAAFGIYTSMYAFKSRGEYLTNIGDVAGIYQPLPYIAASVMILVLSMLGTPPLLGFLGRFYVTNQLFIAKDYVLVILVLLPLGVLVSAYLKIIKSMYFEPRIKNFDRADKGIYISLFVNIILVLITLFNNYEVVKIARDVIYKLF